MDREAGAEVYCAATMRDQAKIVWGEAERMRDRSPSLASRVRNFVSSLAVEETHREMVPLGADADVLDGLNPHVVIIDELHAHRTRAVLDVMDSATGARREPLLVMITTAGTDRTSVCWEQHAYAERVLAGTVEDNSLFCYIATVDDGDDWREETSWIKANPNFGITVKADYLERRAAKATKVPAATATRCRRTTSRVASGRVDPYQLAERLDLFPYLILNMLEGHLVGYDVVVGR